MSQANPLPIISLIIPIAIAIIYILVGTIKKIKIDFIPLIIITIGLIFISFGLALLSDFLTWQDPIKVIRINLDFLLPILIVGVFLYITGIIIRNKYKLYRR